MKDRDGQRQKGGVMPTMRDPNPMIASLQEDAERGRWVERAYPDDWPEIDAVNDQRAALRLNPLTRGQIVARWGPCGQQPHRRRRRRH